MQNTIYSEWLNALPESDPLRKELLSIQDDPKEIEDRFYRGLAFGTGGLRGIIGAGTNRMNRAGTNRMNIYSVGRATFGLAEYLLKQTMMLLIPSLITLYHAYYCFSTIYH